MEIVISRFPLHGVSLTHPPVIHTWWSVPRVLLPSPRPAPMFSHWPRSSFPASILGYKIPLRARFGLFSSCVVAGCRVSYPKPINRTLSPHVEKSTSPFLLSVHARPCGLGFELARLDPYKAQRLTDYYRYIWWCIVSLFLHPVKMQNQITALHFLDNRRHTLSR